MAQENMEGLGGSAEASGKRSGSAVWTEFIRSEDGETAICKYCGAVLKASSKRNGTSTLKRHIGSCPSRQGDRSEEATQRPSSAPPAPSSSSILPGPSAANRIPDQIGCFNFNLQQEECGAELARMIAFHGYPSSIVENGCFRSFVHGLNPAFQMPSRTAVEDMCNRHAEDAMTQLKETLGSNQGQISLATGTAHTVQGKALYMAWQFIDDNWALQRRIAQVFPVMPFPPYHHDTLLGAVEVSIELDEGVLAQLSLATTSTTLQEAVLRWVPPDRLFSVAWGKTLEEHLQKKDFLKDLWLATEDKCSDLYVVSRVFCVTYTSDVLNSVADSIFSKLSTDYIQNCFKAVKALTLNRQQRDQMLSELVLKHLGRYDKRWFSYYCALEVLHKAYSADNNNAASVDQDRQEEFNASRIGELLRRSKHDDGQLRELLGLSRFRESILTDLLRKILGMIYHALVTISSPRCPTSNLCLHELMKLRAVLQSEATDACQNAAKAVAYVKSGGFARDQDVDGALKKAQGVVDKFLKDSYWYMSVPVVLDPRFKMEYIAKVFMEVFGSDAEECIKNVGETIQYLSDKHDQKCRDISGEGTSSEDVRTRTMPMDVDILHRGVDLQRYLKDCPLVPGEGDDGFDILQWWNTNSCRYPTVAMMARDALAMPASDSLTSDDLSAIRSMMSWPYPTQ